MKRESGAAGYPAPLDHQGFGHGRQAAFVVVGLADDQLHRRLAGLLMALIDAGLFDESLRNAQDFELWARLARSGARLAYQRKVLLRYRCREDSLSGNVMNRLAREIRVYRYIADTYDLTPAERAEISRVMELQLGAIDLASGKVYLLSNKFDEARSAFERAHDVLGGWKLGMAVLMLRVAPRLLRRLALSRLITAS